MINGNRKAWRAAKETAQKRRKEGHMHLLPLPAPFCTVINHHCYPSPNPPCATNMHTPHELVHWARAFKAYTSPIARRHMGQLGPTNRTTTSFGAQYTVKLAFKSGLCAYVLEFHPLPLCLTIMDCVGTLVMKNDDAQDHLQPILTQSRPFMPCWHHRRTWHKWKDRATGVAKKWLYTAVQNCSYTTWGAQTSNSRTF